MLEDAAADGADAKVPKVYSKHWFIPALGLYESDVCDYYYNIIFL